MARGQTLESILTKTRAKARLSLSSANNIQTADSHKYLIKTEQDRLWEDYAWPHLRVHKLIALQAGQATYSLPSDTYDAGTDAYTLRMDRVEHISVMVGGIWVRMTPEITEDHYNAYQPLLNQRAWPVTNWRADSNDQIEVWPLPDENAVAATYEGYLRVTGIRDLQTFVANTDRADLDDELLSGYVAANILQSLGAKDAPLKLEAANKLYAKLKGKQTKTTSFNLFGTVNRGPARRKPAITRYVP